MDINEKIFSLDKEVALMKAEYEHLNETLEINLKSIEKKILEVEKTLNRKFDFIGNLASFARKIVAISSLAGIICFFISGSALDYLIKHIDHNGKTTINHTKH